MRNILILLGLLIIVALAAVITITILDSNEDSQPEQVQQDEENPQEPDDSIDLEDESTVENISDTLDNNENFSEFSDLIQNAEIAERLASSEDDYTVFAVENNGFENLDSELPEEAEDIENLLNHHIVMGQFVSNEFVDGELINTFSGETLTVSIVNGEIFLISDTDTIKILIPDLEASNGIIHVIDKPIL